MEIVQLNNNAVLNFTIKAFKSDLEQASSSIKQFIPFIKDIRNPIYSLSFICKHAGMFRCVSPYQCLAYPGVIAQLIVPTVEPYAPFSDRTMQP